jgi:predicted secreted protein
MHCSRFLLIGIVAALGLLAGCQSASSKLLTLTEASDGNPFRAAKGETIQVVLPGSPSAGYTWKVDDLDVAVLAPVGEAKFTAGDASGAEGKFTLTFVAIARGQTNMRLIYLLAAAKDQPPAKQFATMITVD